MLPRSLCLGDPYPFYDSGFRESGKGAASLRNNFLNAYNVFKKWLYLLNSLKTNNMTTSEIRAEIIELINAGTINVSKIIKYFRQYRPEADLGRVREEAKELVAQARRP